MTKDNQIDLEKLLNGIYEAEQLPNGLTDCVPDFAYNKLNQEGLLYKPVVDEYFVKHAKKKPIWPEQKAFAVCLTHDVDWVNYYSVPYFSRTFKNQLKIEAPIYDRLKYLGNGVVHSTRSILNLSKSDPLSKYEEWLKIEEKHSAHSTFFFWPGLKSIKKPHMSDCLYELSDTIIYDRKKCKVRDMIKDIDQRGWEIGLHSSWYTFNDVEELKVQKDSLEKIIGHAIASIRQHNLHYDIRITPSIHQQAGFSYDSTLGFNDNIGFRFGTCYPWNLYDIQNSSEKSIIEIPLIIQDGALLNPKKGLRLNNKLALAYIKNITDEVERVGGVLTLSWHPSTVRLNDWWQLYKDTFEYLEDKNAWFASIHEIGEWWKKQNYNSINERRKNLLKENFRNSK